MICMCLFVYISQVWNLPNPSGNMILGWKPCLRTSIQARTHELCIVCKAIGRFYRTSPGTWILHQLEKPNGGLHVTYWTMKWYEMCAFWDCLSDVRFHVETKALKSLIQPLMQWSLEMPICHLRWTWHGIDARTLQTAGSQGKDDCGLQNQ